MRLRIFDYFRGLAILLIVAGHSYGPWIAESFTEKMLVNLISGGTVLFVFMSGFFFYCIFYPQFDYCGFMVKKTKQVFLPYSFLSLLAFVSLVLCFEPPPFPEVFIPEPLTECWQYVGLCLQYLWTGALMSSYWYVPFIMMIFILSPAFIWQIKLPFRVQAILIVFLLAVSSIVHRPVDNLSPLHSLLYFFPVYMLGIVCAINKEQVLCFIKNKSIILGLLVLGLSALQILVYKEYGNFHKDSLLSYQGIDTMLFQKIALCFFILSVLQKFENKNLPFLEFTGSVSFAIYFLHPWVICLIEYFPIYDNLAFIPGFTLFMVNFTVVILSSILLAYGIKKVFRGRSRFLIGW